MRKKLIICFVAVILIIIIYVLITRELALRPPYVYRGDARHIFFYADKLNRSYHEGERNWEIEYTLTVYDGSPIEVHRSFYDVREYYAETNDIGRMRLTPKNCPYVDDIVSARYQVDWLRPSLFIAAAILTLKSVISLGKMVCL